MLSFGVCVLPAPAWNAARTVSYGDYIHEVLEHAGLAYIPLSLVELEESLDALSVLLTVGEANLPDTLRERLQTWVEAGGAWVSIAGVCGLAEVFGVTIEPPAYSSWGGGMGTLGEGYLSPVETTHPILKEIPLPLHYFSGIPLKKTEGQVLAEAWDAHQRPTSRPALVEKRVGQGIVLLIAPDVTGTLVRIQQGLAVTRDGVPAPDGTAPIADDVLKSGDGGVLDWILDRQEVVGTPGFRAYLEPIADWWRQLVLRSLFYVAQQRAVPLTLLWYYPHNLPAIGHISHDTDLNDVALGERLLEVMEEADIRSTWCVILPGYPPDLMRRIASAGHELAMHFDTMSDDTLFSEDAFHEQWRLLKMLFEGSNIVSNKNHYLRWEGDTEFFDWCAKRGILLDQSKGASKTGEAGFNFGTCHAYYPVDFRGRKIPVLEMATTTQDLLIFAPNTLLEPLLNAAKQQYGILHLLFHPAHIGKEGVAEALLAAVARGKAEGLAWWTAAQIADWEIRRRKGKWRNDPKNTPVFHTECAMEGATFLVLEAANGAETQERWGFPFRVQTTDLPAGGEFRV
jgi:hypothetical protein